MCFVFSHSALFSSFQLCLGACFATRSGATGLRIVTTLCPCFDYAWSFEELVGGGGTIGHPIDGFPLECKFKNVVYVLVAGPIDTSFMMVHIFKALVVRPNVSFTISSKLQASEYN